jgi:hypothetical protein
MGTSEEESKMKRAMSMFGLLAVLLATLGLASQAADKDTWTGWISDSHCGAKGMNAAHKACAETCVKANHASWVFVNATDSKVYQIENQNIVNADQDLGHEVTIHGRVNNDGTMSLDKITPAKS